MTDTQNTTAATDSELQLLIANLLRFTATHKLTRSQLAQIRESLSNPTKEQEQVKEPNGNTSNTDA